MTENTEEPTSVPNPPVPTPEAQPEPVHQDPAEPNQVDTEVETAPQPEQVESGEAE